MTRGIIFDVNGTLIDILTDEYHDDLYRITAAFLSYSGVFIEPEQLRERYFYLNREQRRRNPEEFPEFDAVRIFHDIIMDKIQLDEVTAGQYAVSAAQLFRAASLRKLQLYPGVKEIMEHLKLHYRLAAVSDGQSAWALPELRRCQLEQYFSQVIISGDLGFRKPDKRIFDLALDALKLSPQEVIFVGNDMYRDIYGAHNAGMRTVFFKSNQGDWEFRRVEPDYIIYDFVPRSTLRNPCKRRPRGGDYLPEALRVLGRGYPLLRLQAFGYGYSQRIRGLKCSCRC